MSIVHNFFQFLKGAIKTIQNNGISGIGTGYRYWTNTSPFLSSLRSKFGNKENYLEFEYETKHHQHKITTEYQLDTQLRRLLETQYTDLSLSNTPLVSIIIPTFNQVNLLKKCLSSIENKTTYKNFEIIIVTNNLDENSELRKFLSTINYTVKVFEKDYSFAAVNNFAASFAKGDFLLFLNDDVEIVSESWIESLLLFGVEENAGVVGGKLVYPNGKLQEAGSIIWKNGNAWNFGKNLDPDEPRFNYVRETDYVSGCLLLVKKSIFDTIGGFDTQFKPAYWEEADLCFKIKSKNYKVLYQPACKIIHEEGKTNPTLDDNIQSILLKNKEKFVSKWSDYLSSFPPESSQNIHFALHKNALGEILFIDHHIPEYDRDSGSLRTFSILNILKNLGYQITFWPEDQKNGKLYINELQQRGIQVIHSTNKLDSFLKNEGKKFNIIILSRPDTTFRILNTIKKRIPKGKIIYNCVDLQSLRITRQANYEKNNSLKLNAKKMHDMEIEIMSKANATIFVSSYEQNLISNEIHNINSVVVSNIHIQQKNIPGFEERKDLLFVGGFNHIPNISVVKYLAQKIMPKLKDIDPSIKLNVIGADPPTQIKNLESEQVKFLGHVDDVSSYFESSKILLAPILFGAGVKGKITQSLSYGLPFITTTFGLEGINFEDYKEHIIANDDDIVNKIMKLYSDKELWEKISSHCLKQANFFIPEVAQNSLSKILTSI